MKNGITFIIVAGLGILIYMNIKKMIEFAASLDKTGQAQQVGADVGIGRLRSQFGVLGFRDGAFAMAFVDLIA